MITRPALDCHDDRRRAGRPRHAELNGIDYVEIVDDGPDGRCTSTSSAGAAAPAIATNVRIHGGGGFATSACSTATVDPPTTDTTTASTSRVDRAGDFSPYTLGLVERRARTRDRRAAEGLRSAVRERGFQLQGGLPERLSTAQTTAACPPPTRTEPDIDYLAKDYASFRQLILDRLALIMPDWRERHVPDSASRWSSCSPTSATTSATTRTRSRPRPISTPPAAHLGASPRAAGRLHLHEGCNARAWLTVKTSQDLVDPAFTARDLYFTTGTSEAPGEVFEPRVEDPSAPLRFYEAHNEIRFYTWGDTSCCLPRGATHATLRDTWVRPLDPPGPPQKRSSRATNPPEPRPRPGRKLHLTPGDVLIFEEVKGPTTGAAADADRTRRHVVRLVDVKAAEDPLYKDHDSNDPKHFYPTTPVVEVTWRAEDALPFALCLSSREEATRDKPSCDVVTDVSVARGNVILVDHGRTVADNDLGQVEIETQVGECTCDGSLVDLTNLPRRFAPRLKQGPLTCAEPLPKHASAARLLRQDPQKAYPDILSLVSLPGHCPGEDASSQAGQAEPKHPGWRWQARHHLVRSSGQDRHFVVEIDDEGVAHLRFGDGELGMMPEACSTFSAIYRVGNGPAGNVGADTIVTAFWRDRVVSGVTLDPRNPLPASGGTAPETIARARLVAPQSFRKDIQRAITPDDYARLAERDRTDTIQRAGASLVWTGSWFEAQVAIDPRGTATPSARLLRDVRGGLHPCRRMGHDLGDHGRDAGAARHRVGSVCVAALPPRPHRSGAP